MIEHNLDEFVAKLEAVDVDAAADRACEDAMKDLRTEVVREIEARGLHGISTPGNRGEGPRLASESAWRVIRLGEKNYALRPDERVEDRAFYLEFGTSDHSAEQTSSSDRYRFQGPDGSGYIYPKEVSGVDEYGFWRSAINRFEVEGRFKEHFEEELEIELGEAF